MRGRETYQTAFGNGAAKRAQLNIEGFFLLLHSLLRNAAREPKQ